MTNSSVLGLLGVLFVIVPVYMFLLIYAWRRWASKGKRDCTWCNGTGIRDRSYLMGDGNLGI